jgi:hypothetical protein
MEKHKNMIGIHKKLRNGKHKTFIEISVSINYRKNTGGKKHEV